MSEGKASKKYKKYINGLDKDVAINIAIAAATPEGYEAGKAITLTKKDVASTQNDEHFIVSKILPAVQEKLLEMVKEYKKSGQADSLTSDLLGEKVVARLNVIGKEVQAELQKQHGMDAPAEEQHVSTTAKPAKGFMGK